MRKLECVYGRMARLVLAAMELLDNSHCKKLLKRHRGRCDNVDEPLELHVNEHAVQLELNVNEDEDEPQVLNVYEHAVQLELNVYEHAGQRESNAHELPESNANEPPDSNELCDDDGEPDIAQPMMANDNASTTRPRDEHDRATSNAKRRASKLFSHFPYHSRLALLYRQQRSFH